MAYKTPILYRTSKPTITVGGVSFSADQVKSAVLEIDNREVYIGEKEEEENRPVGFHSRKNKEVW